MGGDLFYKTWNIKDQEIGQWEQGGGYDVNNRLNRDWTPKFATKVYVFVSFHIFLKKMAFWRRAWSLEISRGRLATPTTRFRPCTTSQSPDIAFAWHRSRPTTLLQNLVLVKEVPPHRLHRHITTYVDIYRHMSTDIDLAKSTEIDIFRHISTQKSTFFDIYRQISTKIGTDIVIFRHI